MKTTATIEILKKQQKIFHSVVPFDAAKDKLLSLDFTSANKELTNDILSNTGKFTEYIDQKLKKEKTLYGIGGYSEHRTVYSNSKVFDADKPGEEPRRLHLGTDIWGKPYTKVMAPLDGMAEIKLGMLKAEGQLVHLEKGSPSIEEEIGFLKQDVRDLREGQDRLKSDLDSERNDRIAGDKKVHARSVELAHQIARQLRDVQTGGLNASFVGLIWVAVGGVMTSIPGEFASIVCVR